MKIRLEGSPDDTGNTIQVILEKLIDNVKKISMPMEENEDKWEIQGPENQINVVYLELDFKNPFEKEPPNEDDKRRN